MDCTQNTMGAAIKAMQAIIIPAVASTGDSFAMEQAKLVTDFLAFAHQRLPLIGDREAHQLRAAIDLAGRLEADGAGLPAAPRLAGAREQAEAVLTDPRSNGAVRRRTTAELEAVTRLVVLESADAPDDQRRRIGRTVLVATTVQIAADRAWLLPLGFDPAPDSLEPAESALGAR